MTFLGIDRTGRVFHPFHLFHLRGSSSDSGIAGILMKKDFGLLFRDRMVSVPFELESVEFGILIPFIPLPQKECCLRTYTNGTILYFTFMLYFFIPHLNNAFTF